MESIFREFKVGEIIFRQGDPGSCAYIIESGLVQISVRKNGEDFPLVILGEGEIFGEMAILDCLPRSATAKVIETCRLSVISQESLVARIQASDPIVRLLVSMFIRRARNMSGLGPAVSDSSHLEKFDSTGKHDKEALDQVRFEAEINLGFSRNEFVMNYQPIVDLKTSLTTGYEALIRWNSPSLGMVSPDRFIGIIEESALMIPVGRWIIEQSLNDLIKLENKIQRPITMSINISPRQFADPGFIEHLEQSRKWRKLKSSQIRLEITEKMFLSGAAAIGVIEQCRKLGYRISLDDFGTGYSSIAYLRELQLDVLKVDQSFTRSVLNDRKARSITQAIISLAAALGLDCIVEGVENIDTAKMLLKMGCKYGQGYLFGKAQSVDFYQSQKNAA